MIRRDYDNLPFNIPPTLGAPSPWRTRIMGNKYEIKAWIGERGWIPVSGSNWLVLAILQFAKAKLTHDYVSFEWL